MYFVCNSYLKHVSLKACVADFGRNAVSEGLLGKYQKFPEVSLQIPRNISIGPLSSMRAFVPFNFSFYKTRNYLHWQGVFTIVQTMVFKSIFSEKVRYY